MITDRARRDHERTETQEGTAGVRRRLIPAVRLLLAGLVVVFAFTAVYVTAFHDPRPHGLKIGIVGPQPAVAQASSALDRAVPGGFTLARFQTESDARAALLGADVHGVVVLGMHSDTALVTGAFGFAPTDAITTAAGKLAGASGRSLRVQDLDPLPSHDSRGLASFFTVFGTLIPSLVFGALLALVGARLPARVRWAVLILFSICAGLVVALSVDTVVGAIRGHFWGVAGVAGLLALAAAALTHGLGRLAGLAGVAGGLLLIVLLGQSSSGGAVTFELEPGFYGAISQLFPNGAALSAMRNTIYFHGEHTLIPLLVLGCWAAGGIVLGLTGDALKARAHTAPAATNAVGAAA